MSSPIWNESATTPPTLPRRCWGNYKHEETCGLAAGFFFSPGGMHACQAGRGLALLVFGQAALPAEILPYQHQRRRRQQEGEQGSKDDKSVADEIEEEGYTLRQGAPRLPQRFPDAHGAQGGNIGFFLLAQTHFHP